MGQTLNLKSGVQVLASIRVLYRNTNKHLTPLIHENTVRFVGDQNGEICFEVMNHAEFDLTIDILNTNKNTINKIELLKQFQMIIIERNEVLGCTMVFEEFITDRGKLLMFSDERSRCFGEIKIGFDRVFGATASWEIDNCWTPCGFTFNRKRTETDLVCDGTDNTSRALLKPGRFIEQVRFKETTTEKFYASIKYYFEWLDKL